MRAAPSETELIRRMRAGDEEAFTVLYRRHQGAVFRFALQMSGRSQIAEEATQEVFMRLMRGQGRFDPAKGNLASYLYGAARNQVLRALNQERQYAAGLGDEEHETIPDSGAGALAGLTRAEALESLRQAVLSLPPAYREVVVLCELHEMDYASAAEVVQCPVGTVRSRLHRARGLLAERLTAKGCAV